METNTVREELIELVTRCREFNRKYLPEGVDMHIDNGSSWTTVGIHGNKDHAAGLKVQRLLGIEDTSKNVHNQDDPWHTLQADMTKEIHVNIFCRGLPPMCRIVEEEIEIPESQVVKTGNKTIIKTKKIVCGA